MTLLPPRPALDLQNYTTGADAVKGVRSSEAAVLLQRAATDRGPLVVASDFNQVKRSFEASLFCRLDERTTTRPSGPLWRKASQIV